MILNRSDHKINFRTIEYFIKYRHHCQIHEKSSSRFSFTLNNHLEFNFNVIVDLLYFKIKSDVNKSILHLMNETIRFQVDKWLKDIIARYVWNQLRVCWIDTYFDRQISLHQMRINNLSLENSSSTQSIWILKLTSFLLKFIIQSKWSNDITNFFVEYMRSSLRKYLKLTRIRFRKWSLRH
jgi:hypothetical protein